MVQIICDECGKKVNMPTSQRKEVMINEPISASNRSFRID